MATDIKPRVGFLGTGWIGRHRMAAMIAGCAPAECACCAAAAAPATAIVPNAVFWAPVLGTFSRGATSAM